MESNSSRFQREFKKRSAIVQLFFIALMLIKNTRFYRTYRRLDQVLFSIPFRLGLAIQITGALPVLFVILPISFDSIPKDVAGAISLTLTLFTLPAVVILPIREFIGLLTSRSNPFNQTGFFIVARCALGLALPSFIIAVLVMGEIIKLIMLMSIVITAVLILIIVLARLPLRRTKFALWTSVILLAFLDITCFILLEFTAPLIVTAVVIYNVALFSMASLFWAVIAIAYLSLLINQPPANLQDSQQ